MIDINRLKGSTIAFQRYKRNLLFDLKNDGNDQDFSFDCAFQVEIPTVVPLYENLGTDRCLFVSVEEEQHRVRKSLDRAVSFVDSASPQSAVKYLRFLSGLDNDMARPNMANYLSRCVLTGTEEKGWESSVRVRELIETFLTLSEDDFLKSQKNNLSGRKSLVDNTSVYKVLQMEQPLMQETAYDTLMLLFNILKNFNSTNPSSEEFRFSDESNIVEPWILRRILPLLISKLKYSEKQPHQAYLASKCLRAIISNIPEIITSSSSHEEICEALRCAKSEGKRSHPCLAQETDTIIRLLGC